MGESTYILGDGFNYFLFSALPAEMIQIDEHIFQMGWFNHQAVIAVGGFFFCQKHLTFDAWLAYPDLWRIQLYQAFGCFLRLPFDILVK